MIDGTIYKCVEEERKIQYENPIQRLISFRETVISQEVKRRNDNKDKLCC